MNTPRSESPSRVAVHAVRNARSEALGLSEKAVLFSIADRLNSDGVTWASVTCLADDAGGARTTVGEIFAWLRAEGIVLFVGNAKDWTYTIDIDRLLSLPKDHPPRKVRGGRQRTAEETGSTSDQTGSRSLSTNEGVRGSGHDMPDPRGRRPDPRHEGDRIHVTKDPVVGSMEGSKEGSIHALGREGDGPSTSRTPESISTTKAIPLPPVEVVAPPPAFTLTPPEPVAAKTAPKRAKTTTEPQKPTTAPTMPEDATPLHAKASPAPKAPKGKKPPEERSDAKYLRAFDAGIAKGAGIPAFATPPHGLVRQTLITIATTHARKDGEPITGEDLLAWFEARAAAFRKYAADVPDLKFNGGWSPKGLLWWLNGGCLGEPKERPLRPPTVLPISPIDRPEWKMPEADKGKTIAQLAEEVGRGVTRPLTQESIDRTLNDPDNADLIAANERLLARRRAYQASLASKEAS